MSSTSVEDYVGFLGSMLGDQTELTNDVVRDVLGGCGKDVEMTLNTLLELSSSMSGQGRTHNNKSFTKVLSSPAAKKLRSDPKVSEQVFASLFNMPTPKSAEKHVTMNIRRIFGQGDDERSSREIFESTNKNIVNVITIDLTNGQSVKEAVRFLKLHLLFGVSLRSVQTIKVITGAGILLKVLVISLLESENIQWREENTGMLSLRISGKTNLTFLDTCFLSDHGRVQNKAIENVVTIDLHGQHVKEAMRIVKLHLLFGVCLRSVQTIKVITGYGSHGNGKPKIKESVVSLLKRESIQWSEENLGMLVVKLAGKTGLAFAESGRV